MEVIRDAFRIFVINFAILKKTGKNIEDNFKNDPTDKDCEDLTRY
jgi:hypothetical protein